MQLDKKQNIIFPVLGIVAMILTVVPNLILGEDSVFTYHDQLDGEMIVYILQAKNLFSGNELPEFMGGMPKTALVPPAPALVLLFLGGHYFEALLAMVLLGRVAGFVGMYLLSREVTGKCFVSVLAGVLYGVLPFLPVYGLAQYGLPLLFWCAVQLNKGRHIGISYAYVVLFALTSSLVLVGFGVLGMGALWIGWNLWRNMREKNGVNSEAGAENTEKAGETNAQRRILAAWLLLLGVYAVGNFGLLKELFGIGGDMVSHKAEYALGAAPFWKTFAEYIFLGGQHSEGYQKLLVPVILVAAIIGAVLCRMGSTGFFAKNIFPENGGCLRSECVENCFRGLRVCVGWNLFFGAVAALWSTSPVVAIRENLGSLGAFQLDRLLWIAPCFWYLAAACVMALLTEFLRSSSGAGKIAAGAVTAIFAGLIMVTGLQIVLSGDIKSNIQKLRNPEYGMMSYRDYYGIGVMEQVAAFLQEETGKAQEEYRVVSLGIDPAASLYHGFYSLDGYSNNYPLEYKHEFREVIAPELDKSEYLTGYYDEWGNRCYLFSAECPGYYTVEKGGFYFGNYDVNAKALRKMGGDYLLSAAYIQDAEEQGLKLMNETPFETKDSYYRIYVYEICE